MTTTTKTYKIIGDYKNGKEEGPWVFYRENGNKVLTGKYGVDTHQGSGTYKNGKLVK